LMSLGLDGETSAIDDTPPAPEIADLGTTPLDEQEQNHLQGYDIVI